MSGNQHSSWSLSSDCTFIDTESTSEIFRIWLSCALYGFCLITSAIVPYYMCTDRADPMFEEPQPRLPSQSGSSSAPEQAFVGEESVSPYPDIAQAKQHLKSTSPLDSEGNWRRIWGTSISEIGEIGGVGLELYFRLLRTLGLSFAYMGSFSLPQAVFSWSGNFAPDVGAVAVRATAGNLGVIATGGVPQENRLVVIGCQGIALRKLTPLFAWLDLLGVIVYLGFVAWFHVCYIPKFSKRDEAQRLTCMDFAIEIDLLPSKLSDDLLAHRELGPQEEEYEQHIAAHLFRVLSYVRSKESPGKPSPEPKICEISIVRDFSERLGVLKSLAALRQEHEIAQFKGEGNTKGCLCCRSSLQSQLDVEEGRLKKVLRPLPRLPVLRSYVILNSLEDRSKLLMEYRFSNFRMFRFCQSRALRFQEKAIAIRPAPEPLNIYWQNQDVSWKSRALREFAVFWAWLIVMIGALILIFLFSSAAKNTGTSASWQKIGSSNSACGQSRPTGDGYVCDALVAGEWNNTYARTLQNPALACFCTTKGYATVLRDEELVNDVCKKWLSDSAQAAALGFCPSMLCVAFICILHAIFVRFAEFEKPTSISALNSSVMVKIAVSQFFNTAGIIFCLHYYGGDTFFPFNVIFGGGDYSDFDRGWYSAVGATVTVNMFLNIFTSSCVNLASWLYLVSRRWPSSVRRLQHQLEVLNVYTNPSFNLSSRYAQILTTCFCTLAYSPGIPLLNLFAAFFFFVVFWADKTLLLRASRRPPTYDAQMPKQATGLLLYAPVLHLLAAIFMFSNDCTFPSDPLGGQLGAAVTSASNATVTVEKANGRVLRESTWMLFAVLVFMIVLWLLHVLQWVLGLGTGYAVIVSWCCPRRHRTLCEEERASEERGFDPDERAPVTFDDVWQRIERCRPPASYKMERSRLLGLSRTEFNLAEN